MTLRRDLSPGQGASARHDHSNHGFSRSQTRGQTKPDKKRVPGHDPACSGAWDFRDLDTFALTALASWAASKPASPSLPRAGIRVRGPGSVPSPGETKLCREAGRLWDVSEPRRPRLEHAHLPAASQAFWGTVISIKLSTQDGGKVLDSARVKSLRFPRTLEAGAHPRGLGETVHTCAH